MESEKDFNKWYYNFWYANGAILIFSSVLFFGYWLAKEYSSLVYANSYFVLILKEAAFAGYIACILNMSAEWVNAKRHHEKEFRMIKKLNEELFLAVYGRDIDKSIVDHINEHVLKSDKIRRNCVWYVTLERDGSGVKFKVKNRYKIENITKESQTISIKSQIDCMTNERDSKFVSAEVGGKVIGLDNGVIQDSDDGNYKIFNYPVTLKPGLENAIEVVIEYERTVPDRSTETLMAPCPMDSIKLVVNDPGKCFVINAASIHPKDEVHKLGEFDMHEWTIDDAILPGHGILLIWEPKTVQKKQVSRSNRSPSLQRKTARRKPLAR